VAPQQPSHDDQLERASPQVVEEQHRLVKPAAWKLFTRLKRRYCEWIEFKIKQYQLNWLNIHKGRGGLSRNLYFD
jgi:hypothetical protein